MGKIELGQTFTYNGLLQVGQSDRCTIVGMTGIGPDDLLQLRWHDMHDEFVKRQAFEELLADEAFRPEEVNSDGRPRRDSAGKD